MFTGLIEKMASCLGIERSGNQGRLTVENPFVCSELELGESIAVNGVCLTVESFSAERLVFHTLAETLKRTNLGALKRGRQVNLERALKLGDRLGGHIVSGHVDATGTVLACCRRGDDLELTLEIPENVDFPVVHKGSIAINGISLTVAELEGNRVKVCLIPHTWKVTNVQYVQPGEQVNLEADVIGKYVQALMGPHRASSKVTLEMLEGAFGTTHY